MNATTPVAAPPRPFTERLLSLLQCFNACRGAVAIDVRSLHWIGRASLSVSPPVVAVPSPTLDAIQAGAGLRVSPVAQSGNRPLDLGAVFVLWRPATRFDASTGWRHAVAPDAQDESRATLADFPRAPTLLVDGGHEVVAWWLLTHPLPVDQNPDRPVALLTHLAERLGGDVASAKDLMTTLPFAGVVRNWGASDPVRVELIDVEPGHTYTIESLEQALEPGGGR